MLKKMNPITDLWNKFDKELQADKDNHKNDIFYRSPKESLFHIQGHFTDYRISINLSDLETFLIQKTGQFCERYASDLMITLNTIKRNINNPNPHQPVYYQFIGIRQSGVDGIGYVLSRMTQDQPEYLAQYYRKLYAIRITHTHKKERRYATYVYVELIDITNNIYGFCKAFKDSHFTVNDYYSTTETEKYQDVLQDIYELEMLCHQGQSIEQTVKEGLANLYGMDTYTQLHNSIPQSTFYAIHQLQDNISYNTIIADKETEEIDE